MAAPYGSGAGASSSTSPLMNSLSHLLNSHTPQLQNLHQLLDLPRDQIAVDLNRLEEVLKAELEGIVRERTEEVAGWRARIETVRHECTSIGHAVGKPKDLEQYTHGVEILPRQFAILEKVRDEQLLPLYRERLAIIVELKTKLDHLQQVLGHPSELVPQYQPPPPLRAAFSGSSSSIGVNPLSVSSFPPTTRYGPSGVGLGLPRSLSAEKVATSITDGNRFEDVTEKRVTELQNLIQRGEEDCAANLLNLRQLLQLTHDFVDLLVLPIPLPFPLPTAPASMAVSASAEPVSPSPLRTLPDQPTELDIYGYELVAHYISWAVERSEEEVKDEYGDGGLEGVEASEDLISWVTQLNQTLATIQAYREGEIQRMYDKLEMLWAVMNISTVDIENFVELNQGISEQSVLVYRQELEKMMLLKSDFIEEFIQKKREEIQAVQDMLLMTSEEREAFPFFWDCTALLLIANFTDELLEAHEKELERLQAEAASKRELLRFVAQWLDIMTEERELLAITQDPSRLTGRRPPGAMLAEEKMRKRVTILKPKIETKLLQALPVWEQDHQRPFCINGERIIETIQAALDAKQAEKDLKQRSRTGAAATPSARGRTASVAGSSSSGSVVGSTIKRKAPPTPSTVAPSSVKPRTAVRATPGPTGRATPASGIACSLPRSGSVARSAGSSLGMRSVSTTSTMTTASSGAFGGPSRAEATWCNPVAANVFASSAAAAPVRAPPRVMAPPQPPHSARTPLAPRNKARRESFKPRPSDVRLPPPLQPAKYGGWSSPVHEQSDLLELDE